MSQYPVPCVVPSIHPTAEELPQAVLRHPVQDVPASSKDEVLDGGWVTDINNMLNFNKAFVTKGMNTHSEEG
jgi:hypothetical protein